MCDMQKVAEVKLRQTETSPLKPQWRNVRLPPLSGRSCRPSKWHNNIPFFDKVQLSNRLAQFSVSFYSLEMSPSLDRTCQESFHKHPVLRKIFPRHQNKPVLNRRSSLVRFSFIYFFDFFQSFELVDYLLIPICLKVMTMFMLQ